MSEGLAAAAAMTQPGSVHPLDLRFVDDDWKTEPLSWSRKRQNAKNATPTETSSTGEASGGKPADSRTPRSADPVYQTDDDAAAAAEVSWETQCLACIGLVSPDESTQ